MRTRYIRVMGDIALVPLTKGKVAILDLADADLVDGSDWHEARGYAIRREWLGPGQRQPAVTMHRVIMNAASSLYVDHINGDGLDNRRCNLREATNSQNQANAKRRTDGRNPYKGITWNKARRKWQAAIKHQGKSVYLGLYASDIEAHRAYLKAAHSLFGEFARAA